MNASAAAIHVSRHEEDSIGLYRLAMKATPISTVILQGYLLSTFLRTVHNVYVFNVNSD